MTSFFQAPWLISPLPLATGFVAAIALALAFGAIVMRAGPVDAPRERGSHVNPTPTSGGMAMIAATALACAVVLWLYRTAIPGTGRDGLFLFGFASLMGLSGAIDDLFGLPARLRLGFQVGLCLIFACFYRVTSLDFGLGVDVGLWPPIALIGSAAWLVLGINAINFMDGSNGLAVGSQGLALMFISALVLFMAPHAVLGAYLGIPLLICVCAAGAHLGFLPLNLPPLSPSRSKAFQGDAGALFGGALITGACLQIKTYSVGSVWFGGFLLAPLLVDVVLTLVTRFRQRKDLMQPHKEHLYQMWLQRRDPSHGRLALRVWVLCALTSLFGIVVRLYGIQSHMDLRFPALVLTVVALSLGWFMTRRKLLTLPPAAQI